MFKWLVLSFALALPQLLHAEAKVAVIDTERVVLATADGKKMKETLDTEFKKAKADLAKLEEEIHALKVKKEISQRMQKYQELAAKSQAELQKHQSELIQPIVRKIDKLVADIAHDKGYAVVLEKSQVHYADAKFDLTDEVIHQYERGS